MNKPTKPDISIPESFANNGTKTDFSETKIENGFERFTPEILAGDNLNKFIDDTYKGLNYSIKTSDAVNLINDEEILTLQDNSFRALPLQNSLGYPTGGKTSDDKVLFEELTKRKHSTFDKSKFPVVGSPTITDDGIASGFSAGSSPAVKDLYLTGNSLKIKTCFTTKTIGTSQTIWTTSRYTTFMLSQTGYLIQALSSNRTSNNIRDNAPITDLPKLEANTKYYAELLWDGTTYKLGLSTDDINYQYATIAASTNMIGFGVNTDGKSLYFGRGKAGGTELDENYFKGSIDLKQFSITVDGKEVFSGNKTGVDTVKINDVDVEIPYTESKTGSKIVDAVYRDRVIDLYEQEGQAGYYTIDEENQNFTLPMGEIYGMIGGKVDFSYLESKLSTKADSDILDTKADVTTPSIQAPYLKTTYINGTSGYNIWSNGYCKQWGRTSSGGCTVTLLKQYKNLDGVIIVTPNSITGPTGHAGNPCGGWISTNQIYVTSAQDTVQSVHWETCGYLAEGEY